VVLKNYYESREVKSELGYTQAELEDLQLMLKQTLT
jgi:hypothetical protein